MKYIIGNRQSGVTTDLILEASKFGSAIIVSTNISKDFIEHRCAELDVKCPTIYSLGEDKKNSHFTVNDVNTILGIALRKLGFQGVIDACGINLDNYK